MFTYVLEGFLPPPTMPIYLQNLDPSYRYTVRHPRGRYMQSYTLCRMSVPGSGRTGQHVNSLDAVIHVEGANVGRCSSSFVVATLAEHLTALRTLAFWVKQE